MLDKGQFITLGAFLCLFLLLYFGCDTKSTEHKAVEKSRAQKFELINIDRVISESFENLPPVTKNEVTQLNKQLKMVETDTQRVNIFKELASIWYANKNPLISGHFAERIADIIGDEASWSIAGTTFGIASQRLNPGNAKSYAIEKSRLSFEKAMSLDPSKLDNEINLALSYVEAPLEENPMKGILMLRDLNQKNPENVSVLMHLGRLSLQTGQLEKAVDRLTKVIELRPTFKNAHCMLAEVYLKMQKTGLAQQHSAICKKN